MSVREGVYYAGLMGGVILGALAAEALGFHSIIGLVFGLVVGVGLGYVAEQAFVNRRMQSGGKDGFPSPGGKPTNDNIHWTACQNPYCDWTGDRRRFKNCPRCGDNLVG